MPFDLEILYLRVYPKEMYIDLYRIVIILNEGRTCFHCTFYPVIT